MPPQASLSSAAGRLAATLIVLLLRLAVAGALVHTLWGMIAPHLGIPSLPLGPSAALVALVEVLGLRGTRGGAAFPPGGTSQ